MMYKIHAKKIISILGVIIFLGTNVSFAACPGTGDVFDCCINNKNFWSNTISYINLDINRNCCYEAWGSWELSWYPLCNENNLLENQTTWDWSPTSAMGISCNEDQLVNGQCKLNIYDTLGIRQNVGNDQDPTSVGLFVQDVVLAATMFIGTLVTVALIVSGLMFIFAASSGKDPANAKKGIMGSLLGLLIVVSSYVIIRLVQYIAKWF